MKRLFMETTQIEAAKTAGEIVSLLASAGATQINQLFAAGRLTGIRFSIMTRRGEGCYTLPARVEPVFQLLNNRRSDPCRHGEADRQQAERVAWRQILRWIQAQIAMIETGMVDAGEVFHPYLQVTEDQTAYQFFLDGGLKRLTGPTE
jgi:hypothetical protein